MNHHQLERDIKHLEHVLPSISTAERQLPLSYWRDRVATLSGAVRLASHADRLNRLREALCALESGQGQTVQGRLQQR
jgi:hypothetical protein